MSTQQKVKSIRHGGSGVLGPSIQARISEGKALREKVPRSSHAEWAAPTGRPDPIEVLHQSDRGRLPELLPIRYGRMQQSPFAFFRGAAAVMAWDLSKTPVTGIRV
jgi:hypothetical protein